MRIRLGACGLGAAAAAALASCGPSSPPPATVATPFDIYVTNETSGDLTVIDGATNAVVATIPLGKRPRGVTPSADGRTLYIALSGSPLSPPGQDESLLPPPDKSADGIGVFDTVERRMVRVLRGVSDPEQVAPGPGGKLYVASEDQGTAVVMRAADGALVATVPAGGEPEGVAVTPDGRFAYVTSEAENQVTVIDTATDSVAARIPVGQRPRNIAFSKDSARAYVPGEQDGVVTLIDARTHKTLKQSRLAGKGLLPMAAVLSPDGRRLYLTTGRGGTIVALNAAELDLVGSVKVGARPWGLAISPDGRFLYAANGPSDDVSVVDAEQMTVVATIKAGTRPWGVAVAPRP